MFEPLYKLTKKNQTQTWQIFVKGDEFWTQEGILGGKITKSLPTKCLPKNEGKKNATSGADQALKEAEAKHNKKLESNYFLDAKQANTGSKSFYEVMLAHNFKDYESELKYPLLSSPKLDGIRAIVTKDGMFSRNGKEFLSAPHILEQLKPFFKQYSNAILDGELFCDKLSDNFNKICSLVKRTKPTPEELAESAQIIEYWIFDAPRIGFLTETDKFSERYELTKALLANKFPKIKVLEQKLVSNKDYLDVLYESYLDSGNEGQMVRVDKGYENKRSKFLLKRKEFQTEEYIIEGVAEGIGGRAGTAGYFNLRTRDGKPFKSNIKGDFAYMTDLWQNRESLIGKQTTVKYFALTPDGIPRFPFSISVRSYE